MSQNIHCSKRPKVAQYLLLILLLTDHLTTIKSQSRANKNDAETLTIHQNSPYHSNLDHRSNDHLNENANENNNDLDLYDEPLFFEESEFNEHHQNSPYKHVLNNLESLLKSLSPIQLDNGLTLIPTEARPEPNENQNPKLIYIPAIISIHKLKLSENKSVICSTEINSPAIYDLEAILWTIDQINQLIAFKNGLMFNLAVLDSCSSPIILERRLKSILNDRTSSSFNKSSSFHINNLIGFVTSISSAEFAVAHNLLSPLNVTLISAQDISFLPSKLGFQNHAIQTALPIQYFSYAALQHLKEQNKNNFSIIYSNDSLQSTTMLDSLVNWITSKDNQLPKDNYLKDKKKSKQKLSTAPFCMQTILSVPSNLNTGDASTRLIQLQNEIKNNNKNNNEEHLVLILTESHTTRELLIAYQHLINAGILNRLSFVLIKESNLNIVTGVESIMLNTLVIRESQKSLRDYVEYFEQLKVDNNLRNPFFKQYWQQSTNCGLNRDCLFDQIDPINTINAIQSTFALVNSMISIKKENCDEKATSFLSLRLQYKQPAFCNLFNDSLNNNHKKQDESSHAVDADETKREIEEIEKSMDNLKADLLDQLMSVELDLHQLSKHFNHAIKFTKHAFPNKMVDVLKFSIVNQAYRFDRIANYLNSGLIKDLKSASVSSLTVNHQLLICNFNSPYYSSSLTRSSAFSNSSKVNNTWSPQSWWRCWYSIATITSLIGALISIVCAIYFLFTFDYKVGSTILGYMILLGIFLLYIVNFLFLFPYSFLICWARNYLMSISYTIILSSMLVKVMNSWRLHTYHNYNNLYIQHLNLVNGNGNLNNMQNFNNFNNLNQNTNLFLSKKLNSISTLMSMCLGLLALQSLTNLVWLAIYPPRPQQILIDGQQQWKCYSIQFAVLIETDAIFAVLFAVLLILITMFFSALTWKHSAINHLESRYIAFSCYVMLTTWTVWAFLFKMFHLVELRDLFIVIANLLVATTILACMFIRKLIIFYRLNRAKKYNNNKTHHLVSSPSSISSTASSYYGSVGSGSIHSSATVERTAASSKSNKKISEQLKRTAKQTAKQQTKSRNKSKNRDSPEMNQDNLDNVSTISAITTTSSIISSVKSYFTSNKAKPEEHNHDPEPEFNLSSIATIDQSQFNINQHNLQQELYPMDVYDAIGSRQQSNQNSQNQPDSLFYTSKKNIFNSNHSLYLMEEKDYI